MPSPDLWPAVQGGRVTSLQDYESYPKDFVRRRLVVFVAIVVGCVLHHGLHQLLLCTGLQDP